MFLVKSMSDDITVVIGHVEDCVGSIAACEVLLMATRDLKKGIETLNEAYSAGSTKGTTAAAHALAGILGTFKFKDAADLCRRAMELPVDSSLIAECTQTVTEIVTALNQAYATPTE
jgi:HPt (histidine-containing phosphotransfer) domain-containing protein